MKTLNRGIATLAGFCLALAGSTVAATDQHAAGHGHDPVAKLELDHGRPWANDYGRYFDHPQWRALQ